MESGTVVWVTNRGQEMAYGWKSPVTDKVFVWYLPRGCGGCWVREDEISVTKEG